MREMSGCRCGPRAAVVSLARLTASGSRRCRGSSGLLGQEQLPHPLAPTESSAARHPSGAMMRTAGLWEWLTPSLLATVGITSTEQGSRALITRFQADPGVFQEAHFLLVGLASVPALLRAPGGFVHNLTRVPWWITAILAAVRVQACVWVGRSVQHAPNPGFAKMAVNMNTVWAVAVSPVLFRSRLSAANLVGVVLSSVGTYLCTTSTTPPRSETVAPGDSNAAPEASSPSKQQLLSWLVPGLLASVALTSIEMGARILASKHNADAGLFMQAQLAFAALVSAIRLLKCPQGFLGGLNAVPWYLNAILAAWRVKWLVWIAEAVQIAPNPGIAKTIMGGGDTVLATLIGVVAFGSKLSVTNSVGVAMSVVGTYLCVS